MVKMKTIAVLALIVAILGVMLQALGYNLAQLYPARPLSPSAYTTIYQTTVLNRVQNTYLPSLDIEIQAQYGWFLMENGSRAAIMPRDKAVNFTIQLTNIGSLTALKLWGVVIHVFRIDGTEEPYYLQISKDAELWLWLPRFVNFTYGTNLPRFPGSCCGRLLFSVYGADQSWVVTKTIFLLFSTST
jgi:hypothetical protein